MQRLLLGILALLFLAGAVTLLVSYGAAAGRMSMMASILMRAGLVLGALWLALPELRRLGAIVPGWAFGLAAMTLAVFVIRPKAVLLLAPILALAGVLFFITWLFQPPPPTTPTRRGVKSKPRGERQ